MNHQYLFKQWPETGEGYLERELVKIENEGHWHVSHEYGRGYSGYKYILITVIDPSCTWCGLVMKQPDDVAIHMVDAHGIDAEKARIWLRDMVEEKAFHDKP